MFSIKPSNESIRGGKYKNTKFVTKGPGFIVSSKFVILGTLVSPLARFERHYL